MSETITLTTQKCYTEKQRHEKTTRKNDELQSSSIGNLQLNYEKDRFQTFYHYKSSYSEQNSKTNRLMARTGLFYDCVKSEIKCYFCKHIFEFFKSDEEIVTLHYKYSRGCPLMTRRRTCNVPDDEYELDLILPPLVYDECGSGHRYTNASAIYRESKYPEFSKLETRKMTFKNWPKQMNQKIDDLAEAGLFYTNESDKVKCYDCGLGLKDWEPNDYPWFEHAKYSKNCYYVNFVKGRDFIDRVLSGKNDLSTEKQNEKKLLEIFKENKCKNCNRRPQEVIYLPCNHNALCSVCALSKSQCVICQTTVDCRIRLFYN